MTSKYPTYVPPHVQAPIPGLELDHIAAAAAPTPVRSLYFTNALTRGNHSPEPQHPIAPLPTGTLPPTPAPTPPPSPSAKPKKQQYQTDQSRPFVLPFSRVNAGPKGRQRFVPRSIEEAGDLYRRNIRISTELWQTCKVREEYIADETGAGHATLSQPSGYNPDSVADMTNRFGSLGLMEDFNPFNSRETENEPIDPRLDPLQMLFRLEDSVRIDLNASEADRPQQKKLLRRISNIKRLQRVEQIYVRLIRVSLEAKLTKISQRAVLPNMHSAVIVLLKLLLATVTAHTGQTNVANSNDGMAFAVNVAFGVLMFLQEEQPPPTLSLEETDIMRHREITSKAVSAILILTLKWFKISRMSNWGRMACILLRLEHLQIS